MLLQRMRKVVHESDCGCSSNDHDDDHDDDYDRSSAGYLPHRKSRSRLSKNLLDVYIVLTGIPAQIIESDASVAAEEGGVASLRCHARGTPHPTIQWRRNNEEVVLGTIHQHSLLVIIKL